jgi:hypothetical protein
MFLRETCEKMFKTMCSVTPFQKERFVAPPRKRRLYRRVITTDSKGYTRYARVTDTKDIIEYLNNYNPPKTTRE